LQAIAHGRAAAAKLFVTIERVPLIDSDSPSGLKLESIRGEITLENVDFSYPSRPDVQVAKDLSLTFPAGKTCALVGASGSGKSTVVSLVERFYDPLRGVVRLDGVNLKDLNVKWLRRQIGLVSQEPVLFATTIKGNVAHGLIGTDWENETEDVKDRLIKEACVKANADGFISNLPLGYDTMVGERGFLLSGGQKQRIAIARAIVSDPRILLLDEATSALDTQSEGVVQDALDKAAAGRTTISIAHRLSTIKNADCIYVMGGGEVLEKGTHDELLGRPDGAYARLVAAQRLREEKERRAGEEGDDSVEPTPMDSRADLVARPTLDEKHVHTDVTGHMHQARDIEKEAAMEMPLGRRGTDMSLASEILKRRAQEGHLDRFGERGYSMYYLFKRMGQIQTEVWKSYAVGSVFATLTGCVYPAFGVVYALAITAFQNTDNHQLRHDGDRNALWFFIIAILSMICIGFQNYLFASAAANLTYKLRTLSFKAILRQDSECCFVSRPLPLMVVVLISY
jgi:ATP-binding cassette subfamily B (MDR/TAP) protein 1